MPESEAKSVWETAVTWVNQFDVGDEVWVLNANQYKFQSKKVGPTVFAVVHPKNIFWPMGLSRRISIN